MSTAVVTPIRPALSHRQAPARSASVSAAFVSSAFVSAASVSAASMPTMDASAAVGPTGRLRLTRRGRVVFTSLAAAPLIAVAAYIGITAMPAVATSSSSAVVFDYATIESGQSLWQLASSIAPEADPRDVIADLMRLNQLESSTVSPGQRIAIPEQYAGN